MNDFKIPDSALDVLNVLQAEGHKAYLVGGCVRDMLRGVVPKDYDITTSALPEQVVALFHQVIPTGIKHGTVTVMMMDPSTPSLMGYEVTTFRSDGGYTDGRRPDSVKFETSIVEDLWRRDFSINAMAYDPFGLKEDKLIDMNHGREDLEQGVIRCMGDPDRRFGEDGLRCLRAVRFATTFGFFIDLPTFDAIAHHLETFSKVAVERMVVEVNKILMSSNPGRGINMMLKTGLLQEFISTPGFTMPYKVVGLINRAPKDLESRYAVLLHANQDPRPMLEHLKLPTAQIDGIVRLIKHQVVPQEDVMDVEIKRWIRSVMS